MPSEVSSEVPQETDKFFTEMHPNTYLLTQVGCSLDPKRTQRTSLRHAECGPLLGVAQCVLGPKQRRASLPG